MKKAFAIPKELKTDETRVSLTPDSIRALINDEIDVLVERDAGVLSGFSNEEYVDAGAIIVDDAKELWARGNYIIKVKEPQKCEYEYFREDQVIFSYLHLAIEEELTNMLIKKKVCAIASESVQDEEGEHVLLSPMSEVAGRMSIQMGARFLQKEHGGSGVLLGGVPGVQPGKVVVIGGGVVGLNAARIAIGMGADVSILDINQKKLAHIDTIFDGRIKTHYCNSTTILEEAKKADILVGAVLIPNKKAPKLVSADVISQMKKGSFVIDVAIDQGGIIETCDKITSLNNPVYEKFGVTHCAVPNIPSAVPRTSSLAYSYAILPYVKKLAELGTIMAIRECADLRLGVNTFKGEITCEDLAQSLGREHTEISLLVGFSVK